MEKKSFLKQVIEVRKISANDENSLIEYFTMLVSKGLDKHFHPHLFTPEMAHQIANYTGIDWYAGVFLKSNQNESMIAYVMLRGWDEGYLIPSFGVCVLPSYQKKGIGQCLINIAIITARLRGSQAIRLKVYPENQTAAKFYRQLGFQFQEKLEQEQLVGYLYLDENKVIRNGRDDTLCLPIEDNMPNLGC